MNRSTTSLFGNTMDKNETQKWADWNIDKNLIENVGNEVNYEDIPRHQRKAGFSSGLSIVVNPQLNEYYDECKAQDGHGFRV
jgi:hypothetical protein